MKQRIVVTGGTGGLGRAVVADLIAAGYHVIVTYNVPDEWTGLQEAVGTDNLEGIAVDLLDDAAVQAAIAAISAPIYGLVALAGGFAMSAVVDTSVELWNQQLALNLTTLLVISRAVVPRMQQAGIGRIVTVSSAGMLNSPANLVAYNVAKRGVITFTETLAHELRDTAITVNTILPGTLDTPANRAHVAAKDRVPLDRIAGVIRFLVSEAAAGVTAAAIPVTVTGITKDMD